MGYAEYAIFTSVPSNFLGVQRHPPGSVVLDIDVCQITYIFAFPGTFCLSSQALRTLDFYRDDVY